MGEGRTVRLDGAAAGRLRVERGLNVEEVAKAAKCSAKTVRNAEAGRPVYLVTARHLAAALGVEPAALLLDPPPAPLRGKTYEITLRLTTPFDQFDETDDLRALMRAIATRLGGEDDMEPKRIAPGSTLVTLEVTEEQLVRLLRGFAEGLLDDLGVVQVQAPSDVRDGRVLWKAARKAEWATIYPRLARQLWLQFGGVGGRELERIVPAATLVTLDVTAEQLLRVLAGYVDGRLDDLGIEHVVAPTSDGDNFKSWAAGGKREWARTLPKLAARLRQGRQRDKTEQ